MNEDEYTREDLLNDLEALRKAGLIEIVGINEEGQWLYGPTQNSKEIAKGYEKMSPEDFNAMVDELAALSEDHEEE
jgi:DNA-binding transcriptional ArsR family regulator